jgi:hypothetical protein
MYVLRRPEHALTTHPGELLKTVGAWQDARPSLQHVDSQPEVAARLAQMEIVEVEAEQNLLESGHRNIESWQSEAGDVGFMLLTIVHNLGREADFDRARQLSNGYATRSDIFEMMQGLAANLPDDETSKTLEQLFSYWFSLLMHAPQAIHTGQLIRQVAQKNTENYPARYFSGRDIQTGKPLSTQEMANQFEHARRGLRVIRSARGRGTLRLADHLPHQGLLLDFKNSSEALSLLGQRLSV